ncbi:hypothetical protein POSPLADRAFT_1050195 [Postia placenta MAD-698-R-SB12]|uniref:Cytochrome P450 n=1 Tax=Postia placenta MAD-698-R-SB12 TaxID=670580 RepID=A0A1X6MLJ3_9APHY|nr:hypothetical protein POSPLADRAFT_1050195 [Postia placenta MAD-698-R-SB12]OSX57129.1 hypothetical protein POSPLADRAFT_1050195 [Postia placenta MAD-698-R-SB12]
MSTDNIPTQLGIAGAVAVLLFLLRRWSSRSTLRNIPGPPPQSQWTGNLKQWFARDGADFQRDVSFNYGPVAKIHGFLGRPILYVADPKALQTILVKEEQVYQETKAFFAMTYLLFGPGLLATAGEKHRKQRKLLNPVFSIKHMRHMLPIFYGVLHKVRDAITMRVSDGPQEIDMLKWMGRTALELIGQGGLGYSFDKLVEDGDNEYGRAMKHLQPTLQRINVLRRLVPYVYKLGPAWFRRMVMHYFPLGQVRDAKEIVDTMQRCSSEIFTSKKIALARGDEAVMKQVGEGKDIMSILMKANSMASEADRIPEEELVAQMSTFLFAATDTTSNTLARILQQLAIHPDTQQKLREEILAANAEEYMAYDDLDALPLLDGVCRETLRVFPGVTNLARTPTQDTILPLSEPIVGTDGTVMREILVPRGTEILIGIQGSNGRKERWGEDSYEWKPERWLSPLPKTVTENPVPGVYSNLMTFMAGRRACIGFKFSEMEMKVVLAVLLSNFTFELTDKPIEWNISGVRYPTVGKDSNVAQLPLKVGLYKKPTLQ